MFDDDKVSPVHEEDVLKLSGGGQSVIAHAQVVGSRVSKC